MSVLYTITAYPPSIGGAQLHLHQFARHMLAYAPSGVLYQWDENRTDWLLGSTIHAPDAHRPPPIAAVPAYRVSLTPAQRRRLRPWVRFYRFVQGAAVDRISDELFISLQRALPEVLETTPDIIHNSRVGREGLTVASLKLARELNVPFVFTPNHHHHWRGWLYRHYIQVYRRADALIAYTQFEREELTRLGVAPDKIHVLGVGPILAESGDAGRFCARCGIPPGAPLVLFLGQKYRYKRFELVLEAAPAVWERLPGTYFVFVGPRTPHAQRVFARTRHPQIVEIDAVDLQTKTDALAACDLLCVPSAKESFGGVYVEAGQLMKPVIGGDAPALRETIREGETGFRVGGDKALLAQRILSLLNDAALRRRMGEAGRRFAQAYGWPKLAERLNRVYARLR